MKYLLLVILLRIVIAVCIGLVALLLWVLARLEYDLIPWKGGRIAVVVTCFLLGGAILILDLAWFVGVLG